ncbi:MAG: C-GCAxxG-C-C family protein [Coriobacteriales bacterium]|jgi:hypothetical protein|nr:C-GCAxxG-C-C family protein [Coriobacteriales bacterium]
MGLYERMLQLSHQGFACAQVMMQLVLDAEDKQDPDLIRSVGALNNGVRDNALLCGAFLGGACVISYYTGQGEPDEMADPACDELTQELYRWFVEEVAAPRGGTTCPQMLHNDNANKLIVCPDAVERTFNKAIELLEERDLV